MAGEPRVEVEVASCAPGRAADRWDVVWRVHNLGEPLVVATAWVPHGRFRGDGRLEVARRLGSHESLMLALGVQAAEPPGSVVENAFLILRVALAGRIWRVFCRMRVEFDAQARPHPIVERLSLQSAGAAE